MTYDTWEAGDTCSLGSRKGCLLRYRDAEQGIAMGNLRKYCKIHKSAGSSKGTVCFLQGSQDYVDQKSSPFWG